MTADELAALDGLLKMEHQAEDERELAPARRGYVRLLLQELRPHVSAFEYELLTALCVEQDKQARHRSVAHAAAANIAMLARRLKAVGHPITVKPKRPIKPGHHTRTPEMNQRQSEALKKRWRDPLYRAWHAAIRKNRKERKERAKT